jgi:hypothetical protein
MTHTHSAVVAMKAMLSQHLVYQKHITMVHTAEPLYITMETAITQR